MSVVDQYDIEWIVNSNGELGVKIGDTFAFLYNGHSLVYDETPMRWRHVGKREFGECCHPPDYAEYAMPDGRYLRGDGWQELPRPTAPRDDSSAPRAPAPAPSAGIIGKTIESGIKRGVVLAVQYDHQEGRWYALVQLYDGSFENFSLYSAKAAEP